MITFHFLFLLQIVYIFLINHFVVFFLVLQRINQFLILMKKLLSSILNLFIMSFKDSSQDNDWTFFVDNDMKILFEHSKSFFNASKSSFNAWNNLMTNSFKLTTKSSSNNFRILIFWHHFGYLNTTLRLDWHPLAESGKNPSLISSLASIRASTCCKRARISEKRSIITQLRRSPICVDHSVALITQLRWSLSSVDHSAALITQLRWSLISEKRSITTQLRRPSTCVDHPPASTRKSRPHSIQSKKSFPFNPDKKAVPIQPSRKSRPQIKSRSH